MKSQRGFTLLELLVVITIITILVAILLPALSAARKAAQTIACASNQRQIGMGFYMYAQDHGGWLPPPQNATAAWPKRAFEYQLNPYLKETSDNSYKNGGSYDSSRIQSLIFTGIWNDPGKGNFNLSASLDVYKRSYAMNDFMAPNDADFSNALYHAAKLDQAFSYSYHPAGGHAYAWGHYATHSLSQVMLLTDINCNPAREGVATTLHMYGPGDLQHALWHNKSDNILFGDGHVQLMPEHGLSYILTTVDTQD